MTDREIVKRIIYIRNHLAEYYDDKGVIMRGLLIRDLRNLKDDIDGKRG